MTSLGILQLNTEEKNEYIDAVASICSNRGICVYRFHPLKYNASVEIATGYVYEKETANWIEESFSLPRYVYDRTFLPSDKRARKFLSKHINQIKNKAIFLGCGLPNKWIVYRWLQQNHELKEYLPPTNLLSLNTLESYLATYKRIVLKPVFGSGGDGLYVVEDIGNCYLIKSGDLKDRHTIELKLEKLYDYLYSKLLSGTYLIQPFLSLTNKNRPFDLRVVLQRKGVFQWKIVGKGFRIGREGTYVSNLQTGGKVSPSLKFTEKQRKDLRKQLSTIIQRIPFQLEEFHQPLFELGIDLGISEENRVWILEVNSKPGYQTVIQTTKKEKAHNIFSGPAELIESMEHQIKKQDVP